MKPRKWTELSERELSEQAIRELFPLEAGYRFYPNRYDAGVGFPSNIGRDVRIYVLEGSATYTHDGTSITLNAGEFADIAAGRYDFETGGSAVRLVSVYWLPELVKRSS